jgi:L,D-peptidoglycan transpeptidase YkuD (ErfK/YbiS/YcfS/YnhG family)
MDLICDSSGTARWGDRAMRCAIGRAGIVRHKREGDGASPAGCFALREVLYRADRLAAPAARLPVRPLRRDDGWCDDPARAAYNRLVRLPFSGRYEALWRDDGLYDVVVVLNHNRVAPVPGLGSAIFLHVAGPDFPPTAGCAALARDDLLAVLAQADASSRTCFVIDS